MGSIITVWLVPSAQFREIVGSANSRGLYRFSASMKPGSQDRWSSYRLQPRDLPVKILQRLQELDDSGH